MPRPGSFSHQFVCGRITYPHLLQSIVDAEWKIIYDKLEKCVESGAQIILSRLPIGDLATQFFADRGLFCAGRVPDEVLKCDSVDLLFFVCSILAVLGHIAMPSAFHCSSPAPTTGSRASLQSDGFSGSDLGERNHRRRARHV